MKSQSRSAQRPSRPRKAPQVAPQRKIATLKHRNVSPRRSVVQQRKMMMSTESIEGRVIGVVGLGNMGKHMANNLITKGHDVVVYDLSKDAMDSVYAHGKQHNRKVTLAQGAADVAINSDVIITMLPTSTHVYDTFTGPNGIFNTLKIRQNNGKKPLLMIDSSTISVDVTKDLFNIVQRDYNGLGDIIDAPVSGGVMGAEQGTLTFMAGGNENTVTTLKPLLEKMGRKVVHCGAPGTGQTAKMCNNLILGISMTAVAESFNLGVKLGIDPQVLASVVNSSAGRCWASDTSNPVPNVLPNTPASRDYNGGFGVDLMLKDLGLAVDAAKLAQVPLPFGRLAASNYKHTSSAGFGKKDFGFIYQQYVRNDMVSNDAELNDAQNNINTDKPKMTSKL